MGAITKRHQGIRHLRKDITHIQLTFEYDKVCKDTLLKYITRLPEPMQRNIELLMTNSDLTDMMLTPKHISLVNDAVDFVLSWFKEYRKNHPVMSSCKSCRRRNCRCSDRYLINAEMIRNTDDNMKKNKESDVGKLFQYALRKLDADMKQNPSSDLVREVHISNNELLGLFGGDYSKHVLGRVLEQITSWRSIQTHYNNSAYGSYLTVCPYYRYDKDGLLLHIYPEAVKHFMGR